MSKVAITSDGWTSITQDHYVTVTLHYVNEGQLRQKVLSSGQYMSHRVVQLWQKK